MFSFERWKTTTLYKLFHTSFLLTPFVFLTNLNKNIAQRIKLASFILDSSASSKLFFLEVQ